MLHPFHTDISSIPLPAQFTYPFCYTPHPLCIRAAEELQQHLSQHPEWSEGKMFGVLVVQTAEGEVGYLAAFSGILAGQNKLPFFVPPVYDRSDAAPPSSPRKKPVPSSARASSKKRNTNAWNAVGKNKLTHSACLWRHTHPACKP